MLNADLRIKKEGTMYQVPSTKYKVGIRIGIQVLEFKGLGTLYLVLRTTFSVLILATSYLLLFLMSNAELRVLKVELKNS